MGSSIPGNWPRSCLVKLLIRSWLVEEAEDLELARLEAALLELVAELVAELAADLELARLDDDLAFWLLAGADCGWLWLPQPASRAADARSRPKVSFLCFIIHGHAESFGFNRRMSVPLPLSINCFCYLQL